MIEVRELTKSYGAVKAIDRVSFSVEEGDILGFLGPNGAGKTTTMKILTCYMPATGGTATVNGLDVFENSMAVRRIIGYMPENAPLYMDMTASEYLRFIAEVKGIPAGKRKQAVKEAIKTCDLEAVEHRVCRNLSKGYKQRVGMAQAIINTPPVLVLDEPTSGLDPRQIIEIRALIKRLSQNSTIILCSHILPEVANTCNKVVMINRGHVVAFGPLEEVQIMGSSEDLVISLEVEGPESDVFFLLGKVAGVREVSKHKPSVGSRHYLSLVADKSRDPRPEIASAIVGKGWQLRDMHCKDTSLEDVFVRLISSDTVSSEAETETASDEITAASA